MAAQSGRYFSAGLAGLVVNVITFEQLQAMSDFEVNKALCIKLGYDVSGISEQRNTMTGAVTDYCNDPSDIMPLAFEHKLALMPMIASNKWASGGGDGLGYSDVKPLRAIACCLILVLQEQQK